MATSDPAGKIGPVLHSPQQADKATESANFPAVPERPAKAVLRWLTEGHDEQSIREALRSLHPDADHDAALTEALTELKADGQIDPDMVRGWALRAYRDLYRRCVEIGDFDGARKVMKEITLLAR